MFPSDIVKIELKTYSKMRASQSQLFGRISKGNCSLQINTKKIKGGFKVWIVFFNSHGQRLLRFDQSFADTDEIKKAILESKASMAPKPEGIILTPQKTRTRSAQ
jgi:hypothetical protein